MYVLCIRFTLAIAIRERAAAVPQSALKKHAAATVQRRDILKPPLFNILLLHSLPTPPGARAAINNAG